MKQDSHDLDFSNPYSAIDTFNAENKLVVPDKIVQLMKYCIEKIDDKNFINMIASPYVELVIGVVEKISHNGYGVSPLYAFRNRYYQPEYKLNRRLTANDVPYERLQFNKLIEFKIGTWTFYDFLDIAFRKLRIIYKFQDDHDLVYKSTLWESVKISFQTVEYTKTIPYDPLPSDYIRIIKEYTPEHTLLILIITYILATEISTQLKFIEYKRDRIYSNCTDDGITPEDNIGIAEIKKIAYTLRYDELKDLIKWLDDFTNDRINKMDNIC